MFYNYDLHFCHNVKQYYKNFYDQHVSYSETSLMWPPLEPNFMALTIRWPHY